MIYTASTHTISGPSISLVSGDTGKIAQFFDADGASYWGTIFRVESETSAILSAGENLPSEDMSIYDLALVGEGHEPQPDAPVIVTLSEVKAYLGVSNTSNDELLQGWVDDVSSNIEDETNCVFRSRLITDEICDGNGRRTLNTLFAPILGPATAGDWSADLLSRPDPTQPWVKIEEEKAYIFTRSDEPFRICLHRAEFPLGVQNVKISYRAGYNVIPSDIRRLVIEKVAMLWNESKRGGDWLGKDRVSVNRQGSTDSTAYKDMTDRWNAVISQYRRAI